MSAPAASGVPENDAAFTLALLYVALPCLVFLLAFVRPMLGLPLAAALVFATWQAAAPLRGRLSLRTWLGPAVAGAALVAVVGILNAESAWDWLKHWALINEIAGHEWPVRVELHGEQKYLRFYLASYLLPALARKVTGLPVVAVTAAWYFLGYALVFRLAVSEWARRPAGFSIAAIVLLLMLGGADALSEHGLRALAGLPAYPVWLGIHYETWATGLLQPSLEFASVLTNLAWVPHQSIPVMFVAAMIVLDDGPQRLPRLILVYGLMALWSPYGMIGLLPLVLYRVMPDWRQAFTLPVAAAILAGGAFALLSISYLSTEMPQAGMCLSCAAQNATEVTTTIPFLFVELLPFVLILRRKLLKDPCCLLACLSLLAMPLLHGESLDFVGRGSMGPLFVLALRCAQSLLGVAIPRTQQIFAALAFALCLPTTVSELAYHASKGAGQKVVDQFKPESRRWASKFSRDPHIDAVRFLDECGWIYESQYFIRTKPSVLR